MLDVLLELDDITLYPSEVNAGMSQADKFDFGISDELDGSTSLPIFTSPLDTIINKENWKVWQEKGIKPVLPRTEDLDIRLEGCQYIFAAFSLREVSDCFITHGKRVSQYQYHVCIDEINGHDQEIFNIAVQLRKIYGNQINIMAGNIGNAKSYINYCKAGIDYVRVGLGNGSLVNHDKYGYYYPQASLLIDIAGVKNTSCVGLKQTKIIADGSIGGQVDILKCIALGADYVMIGREFARCLDAAGSIYSRSRDATNNLSVKEEVNRGTIKATTRDEIVSQKLQRLYCGSTTYDHASGVRRFVDSRTEWISIDKTLKMWLDEMYDCFSNAFVMNNAVNWKQFKANIKYGRLR